MDTNEIKKLINPLSKLPTKEMISIKIHYDKTVSVKDLSLTLDGINRQYKTFLKRKNIVGIESELYITKIEKGSILIDFIPILISGALPVISDFNTMIQFFSYLKFSIKSLLGDWNEIPEYEYTKSDFKNVYDTVGVIANNNSGTINIYHNNQSCDILKNEANAVQNICENEIKKKEEITSMTHTKQLFIWQQTNFNTNINTGNLGIIEKFSKTAKKIVFTSDELKVEMTSDNDDFEKEWQDLAYFVDVEIFTINEIPKVYKILKVYKEDTFDPVEN